MRLFTRASLAGLSRATWICTERLCYSMGTRCSPALRRAQGTDRPLLVLEDDAAPTPELLGLPYRKLPQAARCWKGGGFDFCWLISCFVPKVL